MGMLEFEIPILDVSAIRDIASFVKVRVGEEGIHMLINVWPRNKGESALLGPRNEAIASRLIVLSGCYTDLTLLKVIFPQGRAHSSLTVGGNGTAIAAGMGFTLPGLLL